MDSRSEIEQFINSTYEERRKGNIEKLLSYFHPDCRFRIAGSERMGPLSAHIDGRENFRPMLKALIDNWDFAEFQTEKLYVDGETVFAHRLGTIRHVPTGIPIVTEILDKITVREGKIVEFVEFLDTDAIANVVGEGGTPTSKAG
jgi:ketosteroid isomerase-like protein